MMASIIVVFGLPMTVGDILPSRAYTIGEDIEPEPCCQLFVQVVDETRLTWPGGTVGREHFILVGKEEMTALVISQVRVGFAVLFVV
jgi:hypothetical protein